MPNQFRVALALCVALTSACTSTRPPRPAPSPVLLGTVTHVTDGDTIKVQLQSGPIIVRLGSIDAPERDQPQGAEAAAALTRWVDGQPVELEVVSQDRYQRLVAVVSVHGKNVNERLVKEGYAWAYRFFLTDRNYCRWEDAARRARRGLWSMPTQAWIYPSDWRRLHKHEIAEVEDFSHETVEHCIAAMGKR